jgi:methylglutaconyl-CoA hydratase
MDVTEGFARMAELSAERFGSDEAKEGISAFLEKRDPRWLP